MTESTLAKTRQCQYKEPQAQWIRHCASHSIDPFNPKAVELLNFLADGIETKQWSSGTVSNYRSAILNLFPDHLSYWNNSTFCDFFRHSPAMRSSVSPTRLSTSLLCWTIFA